MKFSLDDTREDVTTNRAEVKHIIWEGSERKENLTQLAKSWRAEGKSLEEITALLIDVNNKQCKPKLPQPAVIAIAEAAFKEGEASQKDTPSRDIALAKIKKLFALLSSDRPEEVNAAILAIGRLLKSSGLTWVDVSNTMNVNAGDANDSPDIDQMDTGQHVTVEQVQQAFDSLSEQLDAYLNTSEANRIVMGCWSLTSHFALDVPCFARLCFASTLPVSGKTTAAQMTAWVSNFSDHGRKLERCSQAALMREIANTRKGVRIEDIHRFKKDDPIFNVLVQGFNGNGIVLMADLKDQRKNIEYPVGGCPITLTTNNVGYLDIDVRRRTIVLSMLRGQPTRYWDTEKENAVEMLRIRKVFECAADPFSHHAGNVINALSTIKMPSWMDEPQRQRWIATFAVASVLLSKKTLERLANAAEEVEDTAKALDALSHLLTDIHTIRNSKEAKDTVAITPSHLYELLRQLDPEQWNDRDYTTTKLGRMIGQVYTRKGKKIEKENLATCDQKTEHTLGYVVGSKGPKGYYWDRFEGAWEAYKL